MGILDAAIEEQIPWPYVNISVIEPQGPWVRVVNGTDRLTEIVATWIENQVVDPPDGETGR